MLRRRLRHHLLDGDARAAAADGVDDGDRLALRVRVLDVAPVVGGVLVVEAVGRRRRRSEEQRASLDARAVDAVVAPELARREVEPRRRRQRERVARGDHLEAVSGAALDDEVAREARVDDIPDVEAFALPDRRGAHPAVGRVHPERGRPPQLAESVEADAVQRDERAAGERPRRRRDRRRERRRVVRKVGGCSVPFDVVAVVPVDGVDGDEGGARRHVAVGALRRERRHHKVGGIVGDGGSGAEVHHAAVPAAAVGALGGAAEGERADDGGGVGEEREARATDAEERAARRGAGGGRGAADGDGDIQVAQRRRRAIVLVAAVERERDGDVEVDASRRQRHRRRGAHHRARVGGEGGHDV